MTSVEADILSTPSVLRQVIDRVRTHGAAVAAGLEGPIAFLGCGTSYCVGVAMAGLYEQVRRTPAQALFPSDYVARPDWAHVVISRTGKTTEVVEAMTTARRAGARLVLVVGDQHSPAEALADTLLPLEFAPEAGVIQTRFISAATLALRVLSGDESVRRTLDTLPDQVARALGTFDPTPLLHYERVVFLGRTWRYGLAQAAALNLQESALLTPNAYQTLDYRHGPIAGADAGTLIWSFDAPDDQLAAAVLADARATGATIRVSQEDPQISLVLAQMLALRLADKRGVDPGTPRHLTRAIVL
jgi:glucosamine--fructose-6-phosphate aminotransferase (isomerizing)